MTGKRATIKDCAKINFKPWRRTADMQPTELMPSAEVVNANGVNCRARLRCDAEDARPADRCAWQPGPCAHRQVNGRAPRNCRTAEGSGVHGRNGVFAGTGFRSSGPGEGRKI